MSLSPKSPGDQLLSQTAQGVRAVGRWYERRWTARLVFIFYLLMTLPLWGGLFAVHHYWIGEEWLLNTAILTLLGAIGISWWQSRITADFMFDDGMSFKLALKSTFYQNLMKWSLVPIIGPVFERLFNWLAK